MTPQKVITGLYWWAVEYPNAAAVAYAAIAEIERAQKRIYNLTTEQTLWQDTNTTLRRRLDECEN